MIPDLGHSDQQLRWGRFSLSEQLANIGSEVERTIRAHDAGMHARFDNALARALQEGLNAIVGA